MYDENNIFYKPERGSAQKPDHIMLSFSEDPHTTMTVTWRTSTDVENGYMLCRKDGQSEYVRFEQICKTIESDIDISNFHWVTARGLEAGTKYYYTVGDDNYRSDEFSFETEPENLTKFEFLVITDHQKGHPTHLPDYSKVNAVIKGALEKHPDCRFIFTVGDNCDNGQNDLQWNGMFSGLEGIVESIPYMMTTGNHDNRGYISYFPEPTGKFYLEHADYFDAQFENSFPLNGPEGYKTENYSFDYGNAHFIVMGINAPEIVGEWAYDDLKSSDKTWKFGGYHFPIYPVMPEGQNDDGYPWLRKPIEQGRLDILFEGHEHSFARTFPIKNDEMFDRPSEGTVHYIAGNAGGNIFRSNAQKSWHSCFWPQEVTEGLYAIVEVDGDRVDITAYLSDGRTVDEFSIDKKLDVIKPVALAPTYDVPRMSFKGRLLELIARDIYPENIDGKWYAPFAVVVQSVGGRVVKEKGSCTVEVYGHWATFVEGSDEARTDRGTVKMSGTVYLKRGQLYVPVDDSAKMFDMAWYYAERNRILNWNTASEDKPLYKQPE